MTTNTNGTRVTHSETLIHHFHLRVGDLIKDGTTNHNKHYARTSSYLHIQFTH
jgi:hypothetical protein